MVKALSKVEVTKPVAIAAVLSLGIMPWFAGGRDALGWMVLLGMSLLGSFMLWRSDIKLTISRLGYIWLGFVAWAGLSLVWSVNRFQTLTTLMLYVFLGIAFVLTRAICTNQAASQTFIKAYLAIAAIASALGLAFYALYSYERATSTFYLANPFAAFLLPAAILGIWYFAEKRDLYSGLLTMLNLGVFLLTDSRGGTLVFMVIIFLALWFSRGLLKHWKRIVIILVGALSIALLGNVVRVQYSNHQTAQGHRIIDLASAGSTSTSDRIYYIKSALAIWGDRPVGGAGAGTYATMHPKYQYRVISAGANAHNAYVQTLAELGVVGFGLLAWLLIVLTIGVVRGVKADSTKLPLALGLLALLLHAAIDIETSFPVLLTLSVILAGLCYEPKAKDKLARNFPLWLPFAISAILAVPTTWLFRGLTNANNGEIVQGNGEYDRAIDYYAAATSTSPHNPDWLTAEGINRLLEAGANRDREANLEEAASLAQQAAAEDPYDAQHDLLLARVRLAQKRQDEAEAAYKSAIAKDPYNQPDYYNDLAIVYLGQNKLALASSTLDVVLKLYPDTVISNRNNDPAIATSISRSYVVAAQVAVKQGNLDLARERLRKSLTLDPNNLAATFLQKQIGE